jgi:hypothetical protein
MAILETPAQLLTALGESPFSADPLADLAREGYTLSPELQSQWDSALKDTKLAPPPAGVTSADFTGTLTFQQIPQITPRTSPAPGNYDVLAGLEFAVANTAIGAVYQSGTIPHEIALDQSLSAGELTALGGLFKGVAGGQLSRLHITSSPTLAGTTDGSVVVALVIPIQLDWIQFQVLPSTGMTIARVITTAVGTLQLTMTLVANVVPRPDPAYSTMTIGVQLLDTQQVTPADSPRLTLAPNSPVQLSNPAPPDQVDGTAVLIQNALAEQLGNSITVSVSPVFALPIGSLALFHADVVSKGGMLLAGLQIEGTGTTGASDPTQLVSLLPSDGSNLYLQIQDSVANAVIQSALQSGQLTAQAQLQYSNAVIDSASARFENDEFVAQVNGRLVNECPLNVDLYFSYTRTVSLQLEGGSLQINQSNDTSIVDIHNLWCLLSTLGLIGLAFLGGAVLGFAGAILGGLLGSALGMQGNFNLLNLIVGGAGGGPTPPTIVDITQPIPDSDFLPTLSGGFCQIANGGLLIGAVAGTQPDDINTIIYAQFLVPAGGVVATASKALAGVKVELMAQDVPPPVSPQVPPSTSTGTGKHQVTITYTFVPPTSDQQLAVGQTDMNGVVRFGLLTTQLVTTAGMIKEEESRFDPDAGRFITTTTLTPVLDDTPDLYFRVTMPDGSVVDTRQLPGGLMSNFVSARLGTLEHPIPFTFGGTAVVGNL